MADGVHGSQLAGTKPNVLMGIRPDTGTVTILHQLTVEITAEEVIASG